MISQVDEIKSKLDIADIVQEYFPLKQAGANMKAVCPFHDEKTPSFMVSRERQMWHCFGACNEGGDMFTFIQKMENVEFPEALKILANKAGIQLKYQDPKVTNLKTRLLEMHEVAQELFASQLFNSQAGEEALKYLNEKRKINIETVKQWGIGYTLDSWDALSQHLKNKGYNGQEILQSGLSLSRDGGGYYDRFRDRLMFPIENYHGNIVGFTGRAMKEDESAKYLNSPQTLVYSKSEVIYGLSKAKQYIKEKDCVVLVEGQMDVISSFQCGAKNVAAISGTALTGEQIRILKRYTNNIIFCFDADNAGVAAAKRGIEIAWKEEATVKVAAIDNKIGKDPDDLARENPELWKELISQAKPAMDYFFNLEFAEYNPNDISTKKQIAKNLLNLILKLVDSIEKDFYIKKLGDKLDVAEFLLRESLQKAVSNKKEKRAVQQENTPVAFEKAGNRDLFLQRLLAIMAIDIDFADYIISNLPVEYLPVNFHDIYKSIIIYYTKHHGADHNIDAMITFFKDNRPDLLNSFNVISLLTESGLQDLDHNALSQEAKKSVDLIRKTGIKKKLVNISNELREAEKILSSKSFNSPDEESKQKEKIDTLMNSFNNLITELKEVD
ncbi:MAG: DNA primase [Patescibacteria group bacterium]